jgi:tRNA nucleotidyltransferase (CCA-adding enzyme)
MNEIRLFEVGGCVRDDLMGRETNDVDFAVEASSFDVMRQFIEFEGHRIVSEQPEFLTVKAVVAKGHPLRERTNAADFVMCRKDGPSSDGRHPDTVEPGTIFDDLARRDFTMNAMAESVETGTLIDPHGGAQDIRDRVIRFVGSPLDRIEEDGLRVLRAFRFKVVLGFTFSAQTEWALAGHSAAEMLRTPSIERVREELVKMFAASTTDSMLLLASLSVAHRNAIFRDGLRLEPTLKK